MAGAAFAEVAVMLACNFSWQAQYFGEVGVPVFMAGVSFWEILGESRSDRMRRQDGRGKLSKNDRSGSDVCRKQRTTAI